MMKEAYAGGRSAVNAYTIVRFGSNYGILTDRIEMHHFAEKKLIEAERKWHIKCQET